MCTGGIVGYQTPCCQGHKAIYICFAYFLPVFLRQYQSAGAKTGLESVFLWKSKVSNVILAMAAGGCIRLARALYIRGHLDNHQENVLDMASTKPSAPGKLPGWKDLPAAGIMPEGGSAHNYKTGDWRTKRPVWHEDKCIHCLICWVFCPDSAILVKDGKVVGIDYDHCKGCGICDRECPPKVDAYDMVSEAEFRD